MVGLNSAEYPWLGGQRDPLNLNNWVWSDGTPWGYTNWFPERPQNNRDCVMLRDKDGLWVDKECSLERAFVCEKGNINYYVINTTTIEEICHVRKSWTEY